MSARKGLSKRPVTYALLYRGRDRWRITVGAPGETTCGALAETSLADPFEAAAREFEASLRRHWGVEGPLRWEELEPDWWGADVVPGALRAAGERRD